MEKKNKTYLMLGGTFLPAFVGVGIAMAMTKRANVKMTDLLIFAGLSAIGGYVTAQMLKENN